MSDAQNIAADALNKEKDAANLRDAQRQNPGTVQGGQNTAPKEPIVAAEQPKVEQPKAVEQPKPAEQPKAEQPKAIEQPKPKVEQPKTEEPRPVEQPKPATDIPQPPAPVIPPPGPPAPVNAPPPPPPLLVIPTPPSVSSNSPTTPSLATPSTPIVRSPSYSPVNSSSKMAPYSTNTENSNTKIIPFVGAGIAVGLVIGLSLLWWFVRRQTATNKKSLNSFYASEPEYDSTIRSSIITRSYMTSGLTSNIAETIVETPRQSYLSTYSSTVADSTRDSEYTFATTESTTSPFDSVVDSNASSNRTYPPSSVPLVIVTDLGTKLTPNKNTLNLPLPSAVDSNAAFAPMQYPDVLF